MNGYNGLNYYKIDLAAIGICPICGRRLSVCDHATPEEKIKWRADDADLLEEIEQNQTPDDSTAALRDEMELAKQIAAENAEACNQFIHNLAMCITRPLDVLQKHYNESTSTLPLGEQTELAYGQGNLKGNDHDAQISSWSLKRQLEEPLA